MFARSIRWRLVASSVLLSLVTVAVAGVLAQSLVARAVNDRVADDLQANAQAIAARAVPLMWGVEAGAPAPAPVLPALDDLVRTSAFLADARVAIVDARGDVLVEADAGAGGHEFVLVWPQHARRLGTPAGTGGAVDRSGPPEGRDAPDAGEPGEGVGPDVVAGAMRIRRFSGAWEHRFDFIGEGRTPHADVGHDARLQATAGELVDGFDGRAELQALPAEAALRIEVLELADDGTEAPHWAPLDIIRPARAIENPPGLGTEAARLALDGGAIGVVAPIGGAEAPLGYVRIAGGQAARENALATTRRAFAIAAVAASALAAGLGLVLGHGMSARLRDLARAAGRMSGGDMSARAAVKGRDEIGELAQRFNSMADSLQTSFTALGEERDALRRFMADASHELRTPITALRSFNELLSGAALDDPAARDEFVAESAAQIDRLAWITGHLLDLSRLDAGLVEIERDPIDVGELIEAATAAHRPVAAAAGVVIDSRLPDPPLEVIGDRRRLELALSNLIDNALKHGVSRGGRVVVDAVAAADGGELADDGAGGGGGVHIRVSDDGPGVPSAERERIFERFERGGEAMSKGTPGSGLGLAIVRSIARAHGGEVSVEPADPIASTGSLFVIALGPAVAPPSAVTSTRPR